MVIPSFTLVFELRATSSRLDEVLRIYVGEEPHKAILSGAILRGRRGSGPRSCSRNARLHADILDPQPRTRRRTPEQLLRLSGAADRGRGGRGAEISRGWLLAIVPGPGRRYGRGAARRFIGCHERDPPRARREQRGAFSGADLCRHRAPSWRCGLRQCGVRAEDWISP